MVKPVALKIHESVISYYVLLVKSLLAVIRGTFVGSKAVWPSGKATVCGVMFGQLCWKMSADTELTTSQLSILSDHLQHLNTNLHRLIN